DGHETLKLHETLAARAFPRMQMDTWVDRLTYVPVRTRTAIHGHWLQTDSTWLPRTPANVAKTKLVIPRGFRREFPSMHGVDKVLVTHVDTGRGCRQS